MKVPFLGSAWPALIAVVVLSVSTLAGCGGAAVTSEWIRLADEQATLAREGGPGARDAALRAANAYGQGCDLGNARACEHALVYWEKVHSDHIPMALLATRDVVRDVTVSSSYITGVDPTGGLDASERLTHLWRKWCELRSKEVTVKVNANVNSALFYERQCEGTPQAAELSTRIDGLLTAEAESSARRSASLKPLITLLSQRPRAATPALSALDRVGTKGQSSTALRELRAVLDSAGCARSRLVAVEVEIDEARWEEVLADGPSLKGLQAYQAEFSSGAHRLDARQREISKVYEEALAKTGQASILALRAYRQAYPDASNLVVAESEEINRAEQLALASELKGHWQFISAYPRADQARVRASLAKLLSAGKNEFDEEPYERFLKAFPRAAESKRMRTTLAAVKRRIRAETARQERERSREERERRREAAASEREGAGHGWRPSPSPAQRGASCCSSCGGSWLASAQACPGADGECFFLCISPPR